MVDILFLKIFYGGAHSLGILALDVKSVQAVPNHIGQR